MGQLNEIRVAMRSQTLADDDKVLTRLFENSPITDDLRIRAQSQALKWVETLRSERNLGLMDIFMAEYGLSNEEGIALMCLAEALLRVPDAETMDALIEDKIVGSDWASHLGQSSSPLVNASTWALMLTGRVLNDEHPIAGVLHGVIKRLGEPVTRIAVNRAMRELGEQFVLGESISEAIERGSRYRQEGYRYSYDMLGEASRTADDAQEFFRAYLDAIISLKPHCRSSDIKQNPGISIKLSALYERYEESQAERVINNLVPRVVELALAAKNAGMGLTIDAEEAARLELSLDVIEAVLRNPALAGWDGFGIVVQAYGKRARYVIDWFYALATELDRNVTLRLVKGAYWDTEIKIAQVDGIEGFPVFSTKPATDISYLENAAHLLGLRDRIYPQFATHNAHTVAVINALAKDGDTYEFQKLHGMGDALYVEVLKSTDAQCRIYAPVGVHEDLLAYLVRRLLENGANSSFVNQILDPEISSIDVVADPYEQQQFMSASVTPPSHLFGERLNSRGFDLNDRVDLARIDVARKPFVDTFYKARSITVCATLGNEKIAVINPATGEPVGEVTYAAAEDVQQTVANAKPWLAPVQGRSRILRKAADIYEANFGEIFALLTREAGKTPRDGIAELREAVDFLRFYADEAEKYDAEPQGIFTCISPWNFPLAIFTGQVAAALSAGNAVLAKSAESTSLIAHRAISWLHEAGVPASALQLLLGRGSEIGSALTGHPDTDGVCFTGSTATAQHINRNMADNLDPRAPLIAETGGINAMIVDSTALPEQAVRDILISAFQSAGQRCSALRVLYVQDDVADSLLTMLFGAMDALSLDNPWKLSTDIGPVIDQNAKAGIENHIQKAAKTGRILKALNAPQQGHFVAPCVIELDSIAELEQEIFGPVLHVVRYKSHELEKVMNDINATGYGLTFGMHSRIDNHVDLATREIRAGNIYVNRNQIGAIVGSQPFGGEGLSGTGPKAGGPLYLHRFFRDADFSRIASKALLPGPTGESNEWSIHPRGVVLCAGPTLDDAKLQAEIVEAQGCSAYVEPSPDPIRLKELDAIVAMVYWDEDARHYRQALAKHEGKIIPLVTSKEFTPYCWVERHICVDTTASGGNVELLSG